MTIKNKLTALLGAITVAAVAITGCGKAPATTTDTNTEQIAQERGDAPIPDGTYLAAFDTDSSMFHVNETCDGKGILTVENGYMTIHLVMPSKNVLNLYSGLAEDAQKEGAELIEPTTETVTYSDGLEEEVFAFDVPVPYLDQEFDLALIGKKEKWYDHKVKVSNPESADAAEETQSGENSTDLVTVGEPDIILMDESADGEYLIDVTLTGGSGKATIESPTKLVVKDGAYTATITWSSPHYDYMIVDGTKYEPVNTEGNSVFEIPVSALDTDITVIADTTAMSTPHEIEYVLNFQSNTLKSSNLTGELDLRYADQFSVVFYEGGYAHIHIADGADYVLVPEGAADSDLGLKNPVLIHQPVDNIYLAASSAMDFFVTLNSLDSLGTCSTSSEDYTIAEARSAIEAGDIKYVGKYSAPDYETILSTGCNLAVESTMITHSPDIKEQLEGLGIPVLVEHSSYESSPMGRLEWIKLYGVLLGEQAAAQDFFSREEAKILEIQDDLAKETATGLDKPTVAFFYVSTNGYVNVRKPGDYISAMIETAGGEYALSDITDDTENALSTMNIDWEEFYKQAINADIIIYNTTTTGDLYSKQDLLEKNPLFADFKAYQEDRVYCTSADMFQKSSSMADVIVDMYRVINQKEEDKLSYIYKLETGN